MCPKILYNAQCYMQHSSRDDYVIDGLDMLQENYIIMQNKPNRKYNNHILAMHRRPDVVLA